MCECQARLLADLDEQRRVVRGFARDPNGQNELVAPANSMQDAGTRFEVGWACPFCTRNVLRSFDASALAYREEAVARAS
jgi:hypothetical protein